ncbi:aminoglycoside phosphotransferase family protein [Succinimonas amylolytica]|uniref:aminoglycoside phosphotransferase family protein n=1 Tax=Succinimonas amylolytica TaxID=83769 RepID=UPI0003741D63|nr:phosphotransferase [Succinimonas amylolytica]
MQLSERFRELDSWYRGICPDDMMSLEMVSGDASFRKFYRSRHGILMDAPPETEKNREFMEYSRLLNSAGVLAPEVLAADISRGFLLVSDLGNNTFASVRTSENEKVLYERATDLLINMTRVPCATLPPYDQAFLDREAGICLEWYFEKGEGQSLRGNTLETFDHMKDLWSRVFLEQPVIAVHRDYHSRNIMVLKDGSLAVVDFQDMVRGPLTYDLVSLVGDCYYELSQELRDDLLGRAYDNYSHAGFLSGVSYGHFERWCDFTMLQRHVKCVGIFRRLYLRDGKSGYLKDIPRVMRYIKSCTEKYGELKPLWDLFSGTEYGISVEKSENVCIRQ